MTQTKLYIARHGKTMFNTLGRAQGWSDTPLTAQGVRGIEELGAGLKASGLRFVEAFSSDAGRTLETMGIILDALGSPNLPYTKDKRLREWSFGSLEATYDADLFFGILPQIFGKDFSFEAMPYEAIARAIYEADTAGWAETWEDLRDRILDGFTSIAETIAAQGGGNALVVNHGMTISTLVYLIAPDLPRQNLENGSVTVLIYEDGVFKVEIVGDMSYRLLGAEVLDDRV